MSSLSIFLLGPPRLELGEQPIELGRRKAIALVSYLAVTSYSHSRDTLATLLWPDSGQSRARAALRRTLSVVNTALDGDWLEVDGDNVRLKAGALIDVNVFREKLAFCREQATPSSDLQPACVSLLKEAATLYRDDFLTGFTLPDSPAFDEWQFFEAESLRRDLAHVLEQLALFFASQTDYQTAIEYARRWLSQDTTHEAGHRLLMQLYAWSGQRSAALRQFKECERILEEELSITPSAETLRLLEEIRSQKPDTTAGTRELKRPTNLESHVLGYVEPVHPEIESTLPPFVATASSPPRSNGWSTFVGRAQELAQLHSYLKSSLRGQSCVALVAGDAGTGKTALIQEFARRAQIEMSDLIVVTGNCKAYTGLGDPYLPFREMLGLLTGDIEARWKAGTITTENARRLWSIAGLTLTNTVRLAPALLNTLISVETLSRRADDLMRGEASYQATLRSLAEQASNLSVNGDLAQSDLFEQFSRILLEVSRHGPLLTIVDDAQWMDAASVGLLFHLCRRLVGSNILLVISYRPHDIALGRGDERHPLEPVLHELKQTFGDVEVDLGQASGKTFVNNLLDSQPNQFHTAFRKALFQRTQGHALFTVELLRDLRERGDITRDSQGQWIEKAVNWGTLPVRVEAMIEERIRRLEPGLRDLLTVASVEGDIFTAQVIARVQGLDERRLLRDLSQALDRRHHLVRERAEIQVGQQFLTRYEFTHTMFQQYLYATLGTGERRLLHGEIAAILEVLYAGHLEEIVVSLAHHYVVAGQEEKAVGYLLRSGDRARDLYAHNEAIDHYRHALELLKRRNAYERSARTLMKLGLTYHQAFDFKHARQAYAEGFSLWQHAGLFQPQSVPPAPHALRLGWEEPITLDPNMVEDQTSGGIVDLLFRGLVDLNAELDVIPDVASSWEVLDEGSRYVFHLRDDVYWSDDVQVTAMDFVYSWIRILNPRTGSPNALFLFDVKGSKDYHLGNTSDASSVAIRALDELTLEIELESPASYFPQLLAEGAVFAIPKHVVETCGHDWATEQNIVTNGPYKLEHWQTNQSVKLVRNPDYLGHITGNCQNITLLAFGNSLEAYLEKYEQDELDVVEIWRPPESDRFLQRHAEEYLSGPSLNVQYLGFNVRTPPFNDPRVRQAFAMALDKEMLASVILAGHVFPATGGFVPPGMPGHSTDIGLPLDPDRARCLLNQAGFPGGRGFPDIVAARREGNSVMCDFLSEQWLTHLGINITWKPLKWPDILHKLERDPPQLFRMGWIADYPDPDNILRMGVQRVWTGWQNDVYDELVDEARRAMEQEQRIRLYQRADRMLMEQAPIVPILYGRQHLLIKPWVRKFSASAINMAFLKDVVIEPH